MIKEGYNLQLITLTLTFGLLTYYLWLGTKGKRFSIRKLPVLDEINDIIGRATEMGRPVMYCDGSSPKSVAAADAVVGYSVLSHIAKACARCEVRLLTVTGNSPNLVLLQSIVHGAYLAEDKSKSYRDEDICFVSEQHAAAAGALWGIMSREKIAGFISMNPSGIMGVTIMEQANRVGAVQVCGAASSGSFPDVALCADYFLLGEELFSATAYLSQDSVQLGTISGQDAVKWLCIGAIVAGAVLWALGSSLVVNILKI